MRIPIAGLAVMACLVLTGVADAAARYDIVRPSAETATHIRTDIAYSFTQGARAIYYTFSRVRVLKLGHRLSNGTTMFFAAVTKSTRVHPQAIIIYGTGGYYSGRAPHAFDWALSDYGTNVPYSKVVRFGASNVRVFTTPGLSVAGFNALTKAVGW